MIKRLCKILLVMLLLYLPGKVYAMDVKGYATVSDLLIASSSNQIKPNNSCSHREINGSYSSIYASPGKLHCLDAGDEVLVLDYDNKEASTIDSCKQGFYLVKYTYPKGDSYKGYVCADYIKTNIDASKYKDEFNKSGLPEIYHEKLTLLKDIHPNWKFKAYNTGLDWDKVITNESVVGMSYIQSSNPLYLSLDEGSYNVSTNTYNMMEVGGWYAANKATVAYYMDPRNFLDDKQIFMFENLGYNSTYQTLNVIESILKDTELLQYKTHFIDAATFDSNNVSPIMLAARSRQEVIKSDGKLSSSASGTLFKELAVYNFYNIGANSSGCTIDGEKVSEPILCGLQYAYKKGWTTPEIAIKEGAKFIASGYINEGQNTLYFQKWNVTNNSYGNYSHQYMTNIAAPVSEAKSTHKAYSKIDGLLDSEIEFIIPVYENMPSEISALPNVINKEEIEDKKEEQNIINISEVISKSGYSIHGDFLVNIGIGDTAINVISKLKATSNAIDVEIIRGDKSIYAEEALATNDIIKIKNAGDEYTFRIIIYGDANGDGKISAVDYVYIKNYIMGSSGLNGSYKEAADVNKDSKISAVDYVNVKNYIMGNASVLR